MNNLRIDFTARANLTIAACFLIVACGGGGGGESNPAPSAPSVSITPTVPSVSSTTPSSSVASPTSTVTPVVTTPAIASCGPIRSAQAALDAVNAARAIARTCGTTVYPAVAPLQWNDQLAEAALAHSRDMATRNFFSHTNPSGQTPFDRTAAAGYGRFTGENIAAGYSTLEDVMQGWLSSPGHCVNIMRANYTDFALACAVPSTKADYSIYWTQSFGSK